MCYFSAALLFNTLLLRLALFIYMFDRNFEVLFAKCKSCFVCTRFVFFPRFSPLLLFLPDGPPIFPPICLWFHFTVTLFSEHILYSMFDNSLELECYNWAEEDVHSVRIPPKKNLRCIEATINKEFLLPLELSFTLFFIFPICFIHPLSSHYF